MNDMLISICPHCSTVHPLHTGINTREAPMPGDISVCIECAGVSLWNALGGLRKPTEEERIELEKDVTLTRLRAAIIDIKSRETR